MTELTGMVREIRGGSRDRINELLLSWSRKINLEGWTRANMLQKSDSEDLKQEILLNIFQRLDEYDDTRASFETWAFNRARQVTRSYKRSEIRKQNPVIMSGKGKETVRAKMVTDEWDIEDKLTHDEEYFTELLEMLKMAIETLKMSEDNRKTTIETLELLAEEKTRRQIAEMQNVSRTKVDCNVRRLRKAGELVYEMFEI